MCFALQTTNKESVPVCEHVGGFSKNSSRWSCFTSPPAEKRCGHFKNINEVMQRAEFLGCFTADCHWSATYTLCWAQGKMGRLLLLQIPLVVCTFVNTQNGTQSVLDLIISCCEMQECKFSPCRRFNDTETVTCIAVYKWFQTLGLDPSKGSLNKSDRSSDDQSQFWYKNVCIFFRTSLQFPIFLFNINKLVQRADWAQQRWRKYSVVYFKWYNHVEILCYK